MLTDILLRYEVHAPLSTKGSDLTWTELDFNFIELYDFCAGIQSGILGGFDEWDAGTSYDDTDPDTYVSYSSNIYRAIGPSTIGIPPDAEPGAWELVSMGAFFHVQNTDAYLDFGGTYQISAATIKTNTNPLVSFLDVVGTHTGVINNDPLITALRKLNKVALDHEVSMTDKHLPYWDATAKQYKDSHIKNETVLGLKYLSTEGNVTLRRTDYPTLWGLSWDHYGADGIGLFSYHKDPSSSDTAALVISYGYLQYQKTVGGDVQNYLAFTQSGLLDIYADNEIHIRTNDKIEFIYGTYASGNFPYYRLDVNGLIHYDYDGLFNVVDTAKYGKGLAFREDFAGIPGDPVMGYAILDSSGKATVTAANVTANSRIFLTGIIGPSAKPFPIALESITPGVDFTVTTDDGSGFGNDAAFIWLIIEPIS